MREKWTRVFRLSGVVLLMGVVSVAPTTAQSVHVIEELEVGGDAETAELVLKISGSPTRITGGEGVGNSVVLRLAGMIPGPATSNLSFTEGLIETVFLGHEEAEEPVAVLTIHGRRPLSYSLRQRSTALIIRLTASEPAPPAPVEEAPAVERVAPAVPLAAMRNEPATGSSNEVTGGDKKSKVRQDLKEAQRALDSSEAEIKRLVRQLTAAQAAQSASEEQQLALAEQLDKLINEGQETSDKLAMLERANRELSQELRALEAEFGHADQGPGLEVGAASGEVVADQPDYDPDELPSAEDIANVARSWAEAWANQDVEAVLDCYSEKFERPTGMRKRAWRSLIQARVEQPEFVEVTLEDVAARVDSPDRAAVSFRQSYMSDITAHISNRTLELVLEDGVWRILEERSE